MSEIFIFHLKALHICIRNASSSSKIQIQNLIQQVGTADAHSPLLLPQTISKFMNIFVKMEIFLLQLKIYLFQFGTTIIHQFTFSVALAIAVNHSKTDQNNQFSDARVIIVPSQCFRHTS